ncbi:sodium:solute symporter family transporter [Roseibacillus ishigakijimensis]|uniref:Na+/proline symporter n=1 Tax=Roseibacillus ishigakijimensis TaxID=454146 RepID=A0A934RSS7_9BACT|nr:hypothetical protein [Roseibacillus ishigakijimensis]MBK1834778.1 hypothetical protein [Roseibacillus ishigakijimensis]
MISPYDWLSVAFYLAFVIWVGLVYSGRSRNTSDYFRAGGAMPWWVTGTSSWMAGFSAWTFTGAAGKIFSTGPYTLLLFYSVLLPLVFLFLFTSHRFRRMGVVTPLEAVRLRFGPRSQLFFTWARLPFILIFGGVTLNAVGVFIAAVLDAYPPLVILLLGLTVSLLAMFGGSFGVVASDFVQMFLVVSVTVMVSVLALAQPDIGGLRGMFVQTPQPHYDWGEFARPQFILLWFVALMVTKFFEENSIDKSTKFLMTRSERDARLTLLIPFVGMILGPFIWMIPPTVAAIRHGDDIGLFFNNLKFPEEGAFVLTASEVLPSGMMGLLLCGILGATLTSLDGGLNQGAGIFVRNFYLPMVNPRAKEERLLLISKLSTGAFGAAMVVCAMGWEYFRELPLFELLTQVAISLGLPMSIPLCLGLFWRKTPPWAAWSTVLLGLFGSLVTRFWLTPGMFAWIPGLEGPYQPEEVTTFYIFASVFLVGTLCTLWFLGTRLFYKEDDSRYLARKREFFRRLDHPGPPSGEEELASSRVILATIGRLCQVYGLFVASLVLIPNPAGGRLCFLICGGLIFGIGFVIYRNHRKKGPGETLRGEQ